MKKESQGIKIGRGAADTNPSTWLPYKGAASTWLLRSSLLKTISLLSLFFLTLNFSLISPAEVEVVVGILLRVEFRPGYICLEEIRIN